MNMWIYEYWILVWKSKSVTYFNIHQSHVLCFTRNVNVGRRPVPAVSTVRAVCVHQSTKMESLWRSWVLGIVNVHPAANPSDLVQPAEQSTTRTSKKNFKVWVEKFGSTGLCYNMMLNWVHFLQITIKSMCSLFTKFDLVLAHVKKKNS